MAATGHSSESESGSAHGQSILCIATNPCSSRIGAGKNESNDKEKGEKAEKHPGLLVEAILLQVEGLGGLVHWRFSCSIVALVGCNMGHTLGGPGVMVVLQW